MQIGHCGLDEPPFFSSYNSLATCSPGRAASRPPSAVRSRTLARSTGCQLPNPLASPAQGRLRIAPAGRLYQRFQSLRQVRLVIRQWLAPTPRRPNTPTKGITVNGPVHQFLQVPLECTGRHSRHLCQQRLPAMSQDVGFSCCPPQAAALVQHEASAAYFSLRTVSLSRRCMT